MVFKIYIKIGDFNIHYIDEGTGPVTLLLHGWGSSVDAWRSVLNSLSGSCRFVALDFPGCGKSDLPQNPLSLDDYANLVVDFIKALSLENAALAGHSHGGRVIMEICGKKRLSPPKIVLIDAAGLKPRKSIRKSFRICLFKTVKFFLTLPVIKNFTGDLLKKARRHFGSADYNNAPDVMRKTLVNLLQDDMTDIVPNITCPTLLLWGDNDTATPLYMAEKLKTLIPDAGLCVLKGTGHFSFVEKPFEANAILKSFLS